MQGYALLSVHRLLDRAGLRWLDMLQGKPVPPASSLAPQGDRRRTPGWDLPTSDAEEEVATAIGAIVALPEFGDMRSQSWADRNKEMQGSTRTFVKALPGPMMLICLITMSITVSAMRAIEHMADEAWDLGQFYEFTVHGSCMSRMQALHSGALVGELFERAEGLLTDPTQWQALPRTAMTWSSAGFAYAMVSSAMCSFEALAFQTWRGFPYKMWALVSDRTLVMATSIFETPPCMLDAWSAWFLRQYPSPQQLLTDGVITLVCLGWLLRPEICRIECRNASIRRIVRARDATYDPVIGDVSADFVLMRQRIVERPALS